MSKIYSAKTLHELIESLFAIDYNNKVLLKNEITDKASDKIWSFNYFSLVSVRNAFPDSIISRFSINDFKIAIKQFVRELSEKGFKNPMTTGSHFLVIGFDEEDTYYSLTEGWSALSFDPYEEAPNHVFGLIETPEQKVFPIFDSLPDAESFRRKVEEFFNEKQTLVYFDLNNYISPSAVIESGVGFVQNNYGMDSGTVIDLSECENGDIVRFSNDISIQKIDDLDCSHHVGRFKKVTRGRGVIHTNFYTEREDVSSYLVITRNGSNIGTVGSRNLIDIKAFNDFMSDYYNGKFPNNEIKATFAWDIAEKFAEFVRKRYDQECSFGRAYYSLIYYIRNARFINNKYGLSISILTARVVDDYDDISLLLVDNAEECISYYVNSLTFIDRNGEEWGHWFNIKSEHVFNDKVDLDDDVVRIYFHDELPKV